MGLKPDDGVRILNLSVIATIVFEDFINFINDCKILIE